MVTKIHRSGVQFGVHDKKTSELPIKPDPQEKGLARDEMLGWS
jgi:hypothetical protein